MELVNFPMKSQLGDIWEVDRFYTCVPTSIAACLQYLTGQSFDGATIKDQVYGASYQGATDPSQYVAYCLQHNVVMYVVNGNNAQLIGIIQQQLALNHPVLCTEVDPYADASLGYTHAIAAFKCDSGTITVMDPFIGQPVTKSNAQWEQDLRYNQVWVLEKVEVLSIQQAQGYFEEVQPDQVWKCKQTNHTLSHGILAYYRSCTNNNLNGLSILGLPLTEEQSIPGYTGCTIQRFERSCVIYDPENKIDKVPGVSGPCYLAHIDKGPGRDPAIAQLLNENSQALDRIAKLEQELKEAQIPPTISTEKQ